MDEKQQAPWNSPSPVEYHESHERTIASTRQQRNLAAGSSRRIVTAIFLILTLWVLTRTVVNLALFDQQDGFELCGTPLEQEGTTEIYNAAEARKVPLEAHIMSKCPDAQYCLQKLVVPTMERMSDKVDFRLSFIGSVDPDSDAVSCMHGPSECLGNTIILCAAKIYPDPKLHLGFANCLISEYKDIPQRALVEECAMEHGLDFKLLNNCISNEGEGAGLLRDSALRSADHNVTKSCTVRLDGEIRCIRDGGEWYDCEGGSSVKDLVNDVGRLYEKLNA